MENKNQLSEDDRDEYRKMLRSLPRWLIGEFIALEQAELTRRMGGEVKENERLQTKETAAAAKILNRAPQTLRMWAMGKRAPILPDGRTLQPVRLFGKGGRLLWRVSDLEALLSYESDDVND